MFGPRESFLAGIEDGGEGEYAVDRRGAWVQTETTETKLSRNPLQICNRKQNHILCPVIRKFGARPMQRKRWQYD